jgi:hypothetical protein
MTKKKTYKVRISANERSVTKNIVGYKEANNYRDKKLISFQNRRDRGRHIGSIFTTIYEKTKYNTYKKKYQGKVP